MPITSRLPGLIFELKVQLAQQRQNLGLSADPVDEAEKKGWRDALKYAIELAERYQAIPATN